MISPVGCARPVSCTRRISRAVPSNVEFEMLVSVHSTMTPSITACPGEPIIGVGTYLEKFRPGKFLLSGTLDPASTGDKLRVAYSAGGSRALLEVRTGSAAFNPFRLRELEAFNCPAGR